MAVQITIAIMYHTYYCADVHYCLLGHMYGQGETRTAFYAASRGLVSESANEN